MRLLRRIVRLVRVLPNAVIFFLPAGALHPAPSRAQRNARRYIGRYPREWHFFICH